MKKTIFFKTFIAFVLLLGSAISFSEEVIISAENDFAPYARFDGTGLGNDIVVAAFKSVKIKIKFLILPYSRILHNLKSGANLAGFNVPLDDKSRSHYLFGKEKLYDTTSLYFHNIRAPLKFKHKSDLSNKKAIKVGLVRGYGYGSHIFSLIKKGSIRPVYVNSDEQLVEMLYRKRLDAIVLFDLVSKVVLHDAKLARRIKPVFLNEQVPIYLAFSKKYPKSKKYLELFDKGMKIIKKNGVYDKILISYLYGTNLLRE